MSATVSSTPNDPIAAAIAQAQAAAADAVRLQMGGVPALLPTAAPPQVLRPGAPLSMADMAAAGGLAVDGWLGVNEHGLVAGPKKTLVSSDVIVEIDLAAVQPNFAIKFGKAPPVYYKTYDRVIEARGGSWADAVARAQKADPSAREYPSAEVPMTIVNDIEGTVDKKKTVLVVAGVVVGYSIATTGWNNWKKFYAECVKQGKGNAIVRVQLDNEVRSGNGNTWGVIAWKLLTD